MEEVTIRVAAKTASKDLAASLQMALDAGNMPVLCAIGHSAVGQAVKAVVILNQRVVGRGHIYTILPAMEERVPDRGGDPITVTILRLRETRI